MFAASEESHHPTGALSRVEHAHQPGMLKDGRSRVAIEIHNGASGRQKVIDEVERSASISNHEDSAWIVVCGRDRGGMASACRGKMAGVREVGVAKNAGRARAIEALRSGHCT